MKSFREDTLCVILLLVVALGAAWPYLTQSAIPLDLRPALFETPWQSARPAEFVPQNDPVANLHTNRYYPWMRYLNSEGPASGSSIFWNPDEAMGLPFMALWKTRVFSPFSIPFYLLNIQIAFAISILLKLVVAGLATFYVARRFGIPAPFALFVALAFQMSGPFFLRGAEPMADSLAWLPLLLLVAERLALNHTRAWSLGAIIVALMAFGGSPQILLASALFMALFVVLRLIYLDQRSVLRHAATGFALSWAFGLGIAAFQLLPWFEYLRQASADTLVANTLRLPADLVGLFAPQALEAPRPGGMISASSLYLGAVSIFLLALWISIRAYMTRPFFQRIEPLLLAGVIPYGIALLAVPLLRLLPGLHALEPAHFAGGAVLALAFTAATAAEEWIVINADDVKRALKKLIVWIPALWGSVFLVTFVIAVFNEEGSPLGAQMQLLALAVATAAVLMVGLLRPQWRVYGYLLSLLCVLSSLMALVPNRPATANAFPETPLVKSLAARTERVGGSTGMASWPLAGNGITQLYNPGGTGLARHAAFVERAKAEPLLLRRTAAPVLLLTKDDIQGAFAEVRPALHLEKVFASGAVLFRDGDARGRARMVYAGERVEEFNPALLRSNGPTLIEGASLPAEDDGPVATAAVTSETATEIIVKVSETRPGVLVLADAWYPGWKAIVDGRPMEVIPVDGVFRGVELGEGHHEVVFRYAPNSYRYGWWISLLSLVLVIAATAQTWRRAKHHQDAF